jgi:hypothetical protein
MGHTNVALKDRIMEIIQIEQQGISVSLDFNRNENI